jgi:hypothetical protein
MRRTVQRSRATRSRSAYPNGTVVSGSLRGDHAEPNSAWQARRAESAGPVPARNARQPRRRYAVARASRVRRWYQRAMAWCSRRQVDQSSKNCFPAADTCDLMTLIRRSVSARDEGHAPPESDCQTERTRRFLTRSDTAGDRHASGDTQLRNQLAERGRALRSVPRHACPGVVQRRTPHAVHRGPPAGGYRGRAVAGGVTLRAGVDQRQEQVQQVLRRRRRRPAPRSRGPGGGIRPAGVRTGRSRTPSGKRHVSNRVPCASSLGGLRRSTRRTISRPTTWSRRGRERNAV